MTWTPEDFYAKEKRDFDKLNKNMSKPATLLNRSTIFFSLILLVLIIGIVVIKDSLDKKSGAQSDTYNTQPVYMAPMPAQQGFASSNELQTSHKNAKPAKQLNIEVKKIDETNPTDNSNQNIESKPTDPTETNTKYAEPTPPNNNNIYSPTPTVTQVQPADNGWTNSQNVTPANNVPDQIPTNEQNSSNENKGWSNETKGTVVGGVVGSVIGASVTQGKAKGTILGGVIGAGVGYLIGRKNKKNN